VAGKKKLFCTKFATMLLV